MNHDDVLGELEVRGLVPTLVVERSADLSMIADALVSGGLPVAEVTLRTDAAMDAIRVLAQRGDILVGAGTVLTKDDVDRSVDAGARFVVSPGLDAGVVARAIERRVAVIPGVATATEVQTAVRMGLGAVKIFPARSLGGVQFIDALAAPFPRVRFMPSGGVTAEDVQGYLSRESVLAVGGSWMIDHDRREACDQLRGRIERAVKLACDARRIGG